MPGTHTLEDGSSGVLRLRAQSRPKEEEKQGGYRDLPPPFLQFFLSLGGDQNLLPLSCPPLPHSSLSAQWVTRLIECIEISKTSFPCVSIPHLFLVLLSEHFTARRERGSLAFIEINSRNLAGWIV